MRPMTRTMLRIATAAAAATFATIVGAQSAPVLLRGADLHEDALVSALRPDAPQDGMRTRTIRPSAAPRPTSAAGPARAQPARQNSASVLITFETNSAELDDEARRQLDVVARALGNEQLASLNFAIEGHADPRGTSDDNLRLSQARADAVRAYLVSVGRIEGDRLTTVGKGDTEPLNVREIAAPENRRVTFVTIAR